MILRYDRLAIELPKPKNPSANDAAAIQELLGGKFGEMSTLMNYTFQSFNFRGRDRLRPFYDLTCSIAAEEYSHIEAVSYAINLLLTGTSERNPDPLPAPLKDATDARNTYHFIASGQAALPVDSMGNPWTGQNVFSSGNLKLDLLHNFFLECGARANKMRVYSKWYPTPAPAPWPRLSAGARRPARGGLRQSPRKAHRRGSNQADARARPEQ